MKVRGLLMVGAALYLWLSTVGAIAADGEAEWIVVPDDYAFHEVPVGSMLDFKLEQQLRAETDSLELVNAADENGGRLVCNLLYGASAQRRTIPVGGKLTITELLDSPIKQAAPATECFKPNHYPKKAAHEYFLTLRSENGFLGKLHCRMRMQWTNPKGQECDYSDNVTAEMVKEVFFFWADKKKLSTVIGGDEE